ncbi:MAG TPA: hypothetical protein VMX97_17150 [Hyphomicrobiaceae bacterium]|nr:hypothetical protein [Hyphomicrobiaceae bacterium]
MIDWSKVTKDDMLAIHKIALCAADGDPACDVMALEMDLQACHTHGCPLDLGRMAQASRAELMHDVLGIDQCLDRETGHLRHCFVPRFAKKES